MRGPPGSSQYKTASRLTSHPQHLRNLLPVFSCELAALPRLRDIVVPLDKRHDLCPPLSAFLPSLPDRVLNFGSTPPTCWLGFRRVFPASTTRKHTCHLLHHGTRLGQPILCPKSACPANNDALCDRDPAGSPFPPHCRTRKRNVAWAGDDR